MSKLVNIARGWYNYATQSAENRQLAIKRLEICDTCPEKTQLTGLGQVLVGAVNKAGSTYRCGACGCPLAPKVFSPAETCPLQKW